VITASTTVFAVAVGEACVAQARAYRQHAPTFHILHEGDRRKPLHHAVVVHDDRGIVLSDLRDGFDQTGWQIELTTLPVAGQVLRALFDRAVGVDDAGTGDADEGSELEPFFVGLRDQILEIVTRRLTAPSRVGSSSACRHSSDFHTFALERSGDFLLRVSTTPQRMFVPPISTASMLS
jgi:hypothetical protein